MTDGWNGVKINKVKVVNNLGKFITTTQRKAAKAVGQALVIGASEASVLTPIDTGTLINSRFMNVTQDGTKIVGTAGYTADYAIPVNDPDHAQKFRRPSAQKDFLKEGFERAEPNIKAVLTGAIKTK